MSTPTTLSRPSAPPRADVVRALARIEATRLLRHPAPWIGLVLAVLWARSAMSDPTWSSAQYEGLATAITPLLGGASLATLSVFAREHVTLAEDAPLSPTARSVARLLAGLVLVGLITVVVAAVAVWLRLRDGLPLGDEPGATAHAHYTLPELLQPVLLAAFAVAVGAAAAHLVRQRLATAIVLVLAWFVIGATYWVFTNGAALWVTPLQVLPVDVGIGPPSTDPTTFPSDWLLSTPGEYQHEWRRLVVSPALAAWHCVYVVGLTAMAVAAAVPGRVRRVLLPAGAVVAVAAVLLQSVVAP